MPTYQYKCSCGATRELNHSMTDEPIIECYMCEDHMRKVFTPTPAIFNGSGFYKTDSK